MLEKDDYNAQKVPYEPVAHQLSNRLLLEQEKLIEDDARRLFPKEVRLDKRERIVHPYQFIVANTGPDIDKLTAGKVIYLKLLSEGGDRIKVTVLKSRKMAPNGKRYVLLEADEPIAGHSGKDWGIYASNTSPQAIGTIHDVPARGGGDSNSGGGKDHSGNTNFYGVNLLVALRPGQTPAPASEINQAGRVAAFETDAELGTATIAVLDSGIRFTQTTSRPARPSDVGWDFVSNTTSDGDPFPGDDHLGLHGTKICTIIKHAAPGVGILPVKVSNQNGSLNLYDALCGLEYARTHGAKVVNASWSFAATGDNDPATDYPLLLQAIRDLEESGVVVVAAAGNKSQYSVPSGELAKDGAPKIYPACYSGIQCNVLTVTTVIRAADGKFEAFENYSPRFVDTGALANAGQLGQFSIPGFRGSYEGSSFAAPYVAAKLARLLGSAGLLSKRALLHRLNQFHRTSNLAYAIRDGGSYVVV